MLEQALERAPHWPPALFALAEATTGVAAPIGERALIVTEPQIGDITERIHVALDERLAYLAHGGPQNWFFATLEGHSGEKLSPRKIDEGVMDHPAARRAANFATPQLRGL